MKIARALLLAVCVGSLSGCGGPPIDGAYRDSVNPSVRYELREGGLWSAELVVDVPSGVFPHGAGQRLEGNFTRRGDVLELVCTASSRQDPISGEFRKDDADLAAYNHRLRVEADALVPVDANGETESVFATDLNPFGARRLHKEARP
ncbi:MAG: hypothetical protein ACKO39_05850 [Chthoniobacterales bacterium]